MKLYRDLGKRKYVNSFYEDGEILISNLFSFRNLENQERIDDSEAIKSYVATINPKEYDSRFNIPINTFDSSGKLIPDMGYYRRIEIANCFALSFFQENKHPETSIIINDVQNFSDIIGEELNNKFAIGADIHGPCFYYDSGDQKHEIISLEKDLFLKIHHQPILTAFLKDKGRYKHDREYRMVWIPYYQKKAAVKILDRFRKYGYDFRDKYTYWPDYGDFPKLDEMIKDKLKIKNTELINCTEE
jgi:hypothetical protein